MVTLAKKIFITTTLAILLNGCNCFVNNAETEEVISEKNISEETADLAETYNVKMYKPTYPEIRTPKSVNQLDLEKPLRCFVNWNSQQIISTIPYNLKAFNLVRNGQNDLLPRFEVNGFSFETMPAEKALLKLTKEASMKLVAKDAPYSSISADNLHGELSEVVDIITEAAEIYYTYNETTKTLRISRKANFSLYVPQSKPILLAILDVLRGSGITSFTADFDDYTITFDADYELKNRILNLISYFEENPTLIAYDVQIFNVVPNNGNEINWQKMLDTFEYGTIKSAKSGVLGRILTTSNNININSLNNFLRNQAKVEELADGKFIVPNQWFSRFDIGKCATRNSIAANLSILAKASFEQENKVFATITLETPNGEITKFDIRSKLGENFLIIGIPNQIFGNKNTKSETIVFMVPRIIKTLKTSKHLNKL